MGHLWHVVQSPSSWCFPLGQERSVQRAVHSRVDKQAEDQPFSPQVVAPAGHSRHSEAAALPSARRYFPETQSLQSAGLVLPATLFHFPAPAGRWRGIGE